MARLVKTVLTRLPLRTSYRLPSSLLAKTVPLPSTAGALTHHSNPKGCVLGVQLMLPSEPRVQLSWLVFCQRHFTVMSGFKAVMKYCSGYAGSLALRSGGQIVSSLQYEPTSP